ncbi:hypothetical protein HBI62_004880 [Parastagonospora nodorum]|nr:hypothetical protein HBI62_004880 [Parastagonospora nodorum]KAH6168959.1 hypothetical protein HBI63_011780 [Parastagonospora nodorum]KAH6189744.1 hypothetical protein HBI61_004870 [Parastagonospora nodorum]
MTPSLSPAQTFSSHTSGSTTLISPSPCSSSSPTYTFHWICPVPSCHTCPTRSRPATLAPEGQFDNYEDMQQLAHEYEHEEMGSVTLTCNTGCRARQVCMSTAAKVQSEQTGRFEWAYVAARCGTCGREAGRNGTLVEILRM